MVCVLLLETFLKAFQERKIIPQRVFWSLRDWLVWHQERAVKCSYSLWIQERVKSVLCLIVILFNIAVKYAHISYACKKCYRNWRVFYILRDTARGTETICPFLGSTSHKMWRRFGTLFWENWAFKNTEGPGKDFWTEKTKMIECSSYFKTADKSEFLTGISNLVNLNLWGKEGCWELKPTAAENQK